MCVYVCACVHASPSGTQKYPSYNSHTCLDQSVGICMDLRPTVVLTEFVKLLIKRAY